MNINGFTLGQEMSRLIQSVALFGAAASIGHTEVLALGKLIPQRESDTLVASVLFKFSVNVVKLHVGADNLRTEQVSSIYCQAQFILEDIF